MLRRTYAKIDLGAIAHNIRELKTACKKPVMAVIKADAYGHGVERVALTALGEGVTWAAVATPDEALELRGVSDRMHILILSPVENDVVALMAKNDISIAVCSPEELEFAGSLGIPVKVHIKVDTGMGRVGMRTDDELDRCIGICKKNAQINVEGIFTHFATADESDKSFTMEQLARFNKFAGMLYDAGFKPIRHAANSAAIIDVPEACIDMCRMGISMYGYPPSHQMRNELELKPAMSLVSYVSFIKTIHAGDTVSYGRIFRADSDVDVATIPIGYADGYKRALSGKAKVFWGDTELKQIGRVCMDQIMVDVTKADVSVGDEVVLMDGRFSADDMADIAGTISYEILTDITKRVPRVYVSED